MLVLAAASLAPAAPGAAAASSSPARRGPDAAPSPRPVLVAFLSTGEQGLAGVKGMSIGIMSASQGPYSRVQLLLDLTQGARVASSAYATGPPSLSVQATAGAGLMKGWSTARRRAESAPQLLAPGLLASAIPGGGAYVGSEAGDDLDATLAADREGQISELSLGRRSTLLARTAAALRRRELVVVDLAPGAEGLPELHALALARAPGELLIAIQRAWGARGGHALLWSAATGLAGVGAHELSSQSTNQRGLIAAFDVAPTILDHLGLPVPTDVRGKPIETDGPLRSPQLRSLDARLRVISGRRLDALGFLVAAWALVLIGACCWQRGRVRGRTAAWALRSGALGVMWAPAVVLLPAALEPSAGVEYALIALACMGLGALTDALLPWPRAPLLPAIVALALISVDALSGTQLLIRSLLGPNPILGARFYGIGNELKSALAVLVAAAVAAALYPSRRGRRATAAMACAGALLAVLEGSARIGAGVGGVILVSFGFALAASLLLPGTLTRKRALVALCAPVAGLVALAVIDLATAHGTGHFTGSVLHARSAGDVRDTIVRRYKAAWGELHNHSMPVATAAAIACGAAGACRRGRLLAVVGGDPAWLAALAGGLAAGVAGALVEDSGPVLLVVAMFALVCVTSYLWGRPLPAGSHSS